MDLSGCSETLESYEQFFFFFAFEWGDGRGMADKHTYYKSTLRPVRRQFAANHHKKNRKTRVTVGHPERGWLPSSLDTS